MKNSNILIIDDDPNVLELLAVNIDAAGYNVSTAVHGEDALQKIRAGKPDLVILDVMMPHMDGWEVCKIIKDDPSLAAVKVLILTAKDTHKDKLIGKGIFNADEYMTKPFDIDALLKSIRKLLNAR